MKQISAAQEREELFAALKSASVLHIKVRFLIHERRRPRSVSRDRDQPSPPSCLAAMWP